MRWQHSGTAGLYTLGAHGLGDVGLIADVLIAICDVCGETEARAKPRVSPPTTEDRQPGHH
jgi:hypothetical protein